MSAADPSTPARPDNTRRVIEVSDGDLPLHCPMPRHADWNSHPRVYLKIEASGEALCPYCGTLYRLKGKPVGRPHQASPVPTTRSQP